MPDPKQQKPPKEKKPSRPPSWPGALTKNKIRAVCVGAFAILDGGLAEANRFSPGLWVTPADRFTDAEIALLSTASADELARHPRLLRYIDQLVRLFQHAGLAGAIFMVALPRLERRGLVPPFVAHVFQLLALAEERAGASAEIIEIRPAPAAGEQPPDRAAEA